MRLELQLSEQLYHLFPVNESTVNSTEEKSTKHVDHFPLPAISSHQNSSPNTNPTSESDSPMRSQSQYNPSMTTQTHDSLTYTNSQYNPSDTVRTIDSTSPLKAQTSGSTYFDTLHGEKLLETPSRKDPSPMKSTSNRDSQQKSPSAEQTVSPKKDHDHPPSLLSSTAVDDQSYLDDEFEADEYGEEEFEPL